MKSAVMTSEGPPVACGQHPGDAVVIADAGDSAVLYVWRFPQRPEVGSRFRLNGIAWEIVRYRQHADAWVAVPARH